MRVFVIEGINLDLPMVDKVKFKWIVTHPSETFINDIGQPGMGVCLKVILHTFLFSHRARPRNKVKVPK